MFAGVLSHAWKTCFESEASFERGGQEYLPASFWQWSFCWMTLDISATKQSRKNI